ncbi:LysR substrate-binding domain-containing protein [Mesoterricola silvestris]|uniref:RpiR family transcriptional regulator n=1 Tax=Mesoterricola silvestris TaxID=2927979 RepID=A0AA48K8T7_9BACT|nr:LysR substrate-binding domain-containing protein [Mesoterricola silvestris]BDU73279.1 RpiR family transcriptional regulator [Mesoterricola silvestris]
MEFRLLRYFVAVAEELNVTRAAERLHTSQPSLSQQIRQLEGIIGAPLFLREKHRLTLSDTGRTFLPAARDILASVAEALAQARASARDEVGTLALGMIMGPEGLVLSNLLPRLMRTAPEVHLKLRTMTAPEQILALQRREIMAGFTRGPVEGDDIAAEIYTQERVVAVFPDTWPLARLERVPLGALTGLPLVSISETIAPAVAALTGRLERLGGVVFTKGLVTESLMTSMNAVASGLGFCFFSEYVGDVVPKGVVTRPLDLDPAPTLDLLFAYRKDAQSAALRSLVEVVRESSPYRLQGGGPGGAPPAAADRPPRPGSARPTRTPPRRG